MLFPLTGAIGVLAAGFAGGRAWPGGIRALIHSGVLQKPDGSPLTAAARNLKLKRSPRIPCVSDP